MILNSQYVYPTFIDDMDRHTIENKKDAIDKVLPGLFKAMESCDLCGRACGINRLKGEMGFCRASREAVVYSYADHHGEEPPLSGRHGSGTIFFSHCSMGCVYCQNYQFSQGNAGKPVQAEALSVMMLELQKKNCHNINLVSPTPFMPSILEGLRLAYASGLKLPVVYNTGGYDSPYVIEALAGIVDIYLPDMRYASEEMAIKYSRAPGYVAINRMAVKEMARQSDGLKISRGLAVKGLIIRLLVLPNKVSGTADSLEFIARELGKDTHLSIMSQYYPAYKACNYADISRRIQEKEYNDVLERTEKLGLHNGWIQPYDSEFDGRFAGETFLPNI